ncbi:Crp/Fnr family transcriptional regulator [Larkinella terrae]|uniref:Cyclic nucleotide-binding domain-containing protein n=1 Tax=Larkinella terrae TaxID=2025311 RepID=A0A7K0ET60_9BACT|nr:Crp/Fnr family transcriptional regulator [Larkinella terrae]MRS64736.1 cyclic nucleotide-binding domain-containing protein [Larkinella terrae]
MYDSILAHVGQFIDLEPAEIDYFTSLLRFKLLRKRQYLVQAGDVCKFDSFVVKGCLRTYFVDDRGSEHVVQFAVENWWTGDLYSFLTQSSAAYNTDALEDSELLQIDQASLDELYRRVPKFERFFRIISQRAFVSAEKRVIATISQTAEERYLNFIERYPGLDQRVPQHLIASYLGFTPEFLSRIRKQQASRRK